MSTVWDDARSVLGTVAPLLASALGGPLAGTAASAVVAALGLAPDADAAATTRALQTATPDQLLALKQADQKFQIDMKSLDLEPDRLAGADRASARQRQIEVRDQTPAYLAGVLFAGLFGLLGLLAFHEVPVANGTALNILLGVLASGSASACAYFFGATARSAAAEQALADSVPVSALHKGIVS